MLEKDKNELVSFIHSMKSLPEITKVYVDEARNLIVHLKVGNYNLRLSFTDNVIKDKIRDLSLHVNKPSRFKSDEEAVKYYIYSEWEPSFKGTLIKLLNDSTRIIEGNDNIITILIGRLPRDNEGNIIGDYIDISKDYRREYMA